MYESLKLDKKYRMLFFLSAFMYILYVLPIILADRYYNDDLSRALYGLTGWAGDGRPLTEYILRFLCDGYPIIDISPMPLVLGCVILAYCVTLYLQKISINRDGLLMQVFCELLVISNPFLLCNLAYKFDSFSMLLPLATVFLMFSFEAKNRILDFIMKFVLLLCVLCLYQPVVGAWASLFLMDTWLNYCSEGKARIIEIVKSKLHHLLAAICTFLIYMLVISKLFVDKDGWRANASSIGISAIQMKEKVLDIGGVIKLYLEGYNGLFAVVVCVFLLIALSCFVLQGALRVAESKDADGIRNYVLGCLAALVVFFAICIVPVCPLLFLPNYGISDRVLIAVSAALFFVSVCANYSKGKLRIITMVLLGIIVLRSYTYSYAYGDAMESQKDYETYVVQNIARDIESLDPDRKVDSIRIEGEMPYSPQVENLCKKYPQFNTIVPRYMYNENWIGITYLKYYLPQNITPLQDEVSEEMMGSGAERVENSLYRLSVSGNVVRVEFR